MLAFMPSNGPNRTCVPLGGAKAAPELGYGAKSAYIPQRGAQCLMLSQTPSSCLVLEQSQATCLVVGQGPVAWVVVRQSPPAHAVVANSPLACHVVGRMPLACHLVQQNQLACPSMENSVPAWLVVCQIEPISPMVGQGVPKCNVGMQSPPAERLLCGHYAVGNPSSSNEGSSQGSGLRCLMDHSTKDHGNCLSHQRGTRCTKFGEQVLREPSRGSVSA